MRAWFVPVLVVIAGGVGLIFGTGQLDGIARAHLRSATPFQLDFCQIEANEPAKTSLPMFLSEVQYLSSFAQSISILEPGLAERLASAFARHPLVETVRSVRMNAPPRIVVELKFREPA